MTTPRQSPLALTQANFNRLPALLHPFEFRQWSGLEEKKLKRQMDNGLLPTYPPTVDAAGNRLPTHGEKRLLHKATLARLCGLRYEGVEPSPPAPKSLPKGAQGSPTAPRPSTTGPKHRTREAAPT